MSDTSGQQQTPDSTQSSVAPGASSKDERTWAMLCHLAGLLGFLGPLIIWLIKKDEYRLVDDQGKESLNFQITILIAIMISFALCFVLIGFLLLPLVCLADLILIIIATMKANSGEVYRYPFALRLIK
ncbi:MAG: DUF4870 domain-containing protein [Phycisphaerae bacterium]|nr:DUF4870 domain-containing protein [Phycisphaerae bacterium]